MSDVYTWKWKRKNNTFLQFSKNEKKIGTVALYEFRDADDNECYEYQAYLGGKDVGRFFVMKTAKDAVREAYVTKTKDTPTPYIRKPLRG
jgi:hypothetical protein